MSVAVLLVVPVPPCVELIAPVVLFFTPKVAPVTYTDKLHEPLDATDPPLKLTVPLPAEAEKVPPHVLCAFGELETITPAGSGSLKATPVCTCEVGLWIVKLSSELSPTVIEVGEKLLLIVGGVPTRRLAEAVLPVPPLVEETLPVVFV